MLPLEFALLMISFRSLFSKRIFARATTLLVGAVLAVRFRTVAAALRAAGLDEGTTFSSYHRVLSRARCRPPAQEGTATAIADRPALGSERSVGSSRSLSLASTARRPASWRLPPERPCGGIRAYPLYLCNVFLSKIRRANWIRGPSCARISGSIRSTCFGGLSDDGTPRNLCAWKWPLRKFVGTSALRSSANGRSWRSFARRLVCWACSR
jgi:hypothetical protein